MPYDNSYNKHISELMTERRERLLKHLNNNDLNVKADMTQTEDLEGGSGFRSGMNEMTGAYEHQKGITRKVGGSTKSLEQVNIEHESESVRGAGMPNVIGTQQPFKHPYKNDDSMHGYGAYDSESDEETLTGKGFWSDFADGFMSVINPVIDVATKVAPLAKAFGGKKRGRPAKGKGVGMGDKIDGSGIFDFMKKSSPIMSVMKEVKKAVPIIKTVVNDVTGEGKKKRGRPAKSLKAGVRVEKEIEGGAKLNLIPSSLQPGSSMSGMGTGSGTGSGTLLMDIIRPKKGGSKLIVSNKKIADELVKEEQPLKISADPLVKGGKKQPSKWALLVKKIMNEKKLKMKDAIAHIKSNNLY